MRRRPQAVLFDLDGTLLDTLQDIADAANRVLRAHGFASHEVDAYRRFVGDGIRALVSRALPPGHRDDETIERCLRDFREDYGRHWSVATRPYPGVPEMLDALRRRGLRRAILSNKPDDLTKQCVAGLLPHQRFDVVLGQREGTPAKPDPTSAQEVCRYLGVAPCDCVLVGDSPVDVETALAAGMVPVGVAWGFRSEDELREAGACFIAHDPVELLALLGEGGIPSGGFRT